jgi:hypothetical protein
MPRSLPDRARRGPILASTIAIALLAAACGSSTTASTAPSVGPAASATSKAATPAASPSSAPSAAASNGPRASLATTGRIAVTDKGYALTLLDGWTRIDLGEDLMKQLIQAGGASISETMSATLSSQISQLAASGLSIFALREATGDAQAGTTLNVISVPMPMSGVTMDLFEPIVVGQLKTALGKDVDIATSRVQAPAGEFLKLTYQLDGALGSYATTQYFFVGANQQIVITCGTPGTSATVARECETMAKSLEITS